MKTHETMIEIIRWVYARDAAKTSWAEAWRAASEDLPLEELFAIEEVSRYVHHSARDQVRAQLCRMGLPILGSSLFDANIYVHDDWFIAPFRGKPRLYRGEGSEMGDWFSDEIEIPEPTLIESGPYTIVVYSKDALAVFLTARRRSPLRWATEATP